ncbi:Receptor-like protein kinase HSL1 [Hordeum vulgare]|nr:Receptor-like protein kinase HSL1 [Hordeum vulgare]
MNPSDPAALARPAAKKAPEKPWSDLTSAKLAKLDAESTKRRNQRNKDREKKAISPSREKASSKAEEKRGAASIALQGRTLDNMMSQKEVGEERRSKGKEQQMNMYLDLQTKKFEMKEAVQRRKLGIEKADQLKKLEIEATNVENRTKEVALASMSVGKNNMSPERKACAETLELPTSPCYENAKRNFDEVANEKLDNLANDDPPKVEPIMQTRTLRIGNGAGASCSSVMDALKCAYACFMVKSACTCAGSDAMSSESVFIVGSSETSSEMVDMPASIRLTRRLCQSVAWAVTSCFIFIEMLS